MGLGNIFGSLFKGVKPSTKPKTVNPDYKDGDSTTPDTFNQYQDVGTVRTLGTDSFDIIKELHRYDPDAANALWAMLRFANTKLNLIYKDEKGVFDADKTREINTTIKALWLFSVNQQSPEELADAIRRQLFMYGGVGVELILDANKYPESFVLVRNKDILWKYKSGRYIPYQKKSGGSGEVNLDIPTFFFQDLDKDPNNAAAESPLLTAIQAIAFKQQVIGDIQRVMKKAGYPKMRVKVLEDVMRKYAPKEYKSDEVKLGNWLKKQKANLAIELGKVKPEDALVVFDSIEVDYLQSGNNGTIDFRPIMEILDGQVVSALKSLPSILGKGKGGSQNIASMEAMVYINTPTYLQRKSEKILSQMFTMSVRLMGYKGYIECVHDSINLRPELELEPQKLAKQNRIMQLQSYGHIDDSEAALILGIDHLPLEPLAGTEFLTGGPQVDVGNVSPNADPLGRSITGGEGAGSTRGNSNKKNDKPK